MSGPDWGGEGLRRFNEGLEVSKEGLEVSKEGFKNFGEGFGKGSLSISTKCASNTLTQTV